jgi:putative membrane protein
MAHQSTWPNVTCQAHSPPVAAAKGTQGGSKRGLFLTTEQWSEQVALSAAWPVLGSEQVLRPPSVVLNAIGNVDVRTSGIERADSEQPRESGAEPQLAVDQGSRARTHLANERTFLAWLRTGLSLVAVGLAVAGLLPVDLVPGVPYVRTFSILLVLSGTTLVIYGALRYVRVSDQIETGVYDPTSTAIVTIAAIVGFLGILTIPLVLLLR